MHDITPSQIPRAGYEYQDLLAINFLVDFYINPEKYEWVKIEATEKEYQGIDDIVAKIKGEEKFICMQVKFRVEPDSEGSKLSFDWLLKKSGSGKSLLQKWAQKSIKLANSEKLQEALLITNSKPDAEVNYSLNKKDKIDFEKIPACYKKSIIEQLGGEHDAKTFFNNFIFSHSHPENLDKLESHINSKLNPHFVNNEGFLEIKEVVKKWAMKKDSPKPKGYIFYNNVRILFEGSKRGRSISQIFPIPKDYVIADKKFHDEMIKLSEKQGIIVLYGEPGTGKSTYLAYLGNFLLEQGIAVIRHHYFISSEDQASERYRYATIENSLLRQLEKIASKSFKKEELKDAIEECAKIKRLVIIVDGLDHAWRENKEAGLNQLQTLFNRIIKLPSNVTLIIGTQKVSDIHLPGKLLAESPKDQWKKIPYMDIMSIKSWIEKKSLKNDLFNIPKQIEEKEKYFGNLAKAFQEISGGLPIHLVYSINHLSRSKDIIIPDRIRELPRCPAGDIRKYYDELWYDLSTASKEILHLLAATEFSWTPGGILECMNIDSTSMDDYGNISHMLDDSKKSITPFHGSIIAFIRDKREHEDIAKRLLPKAVDWLDKKAPKYLKKCWLWVTQSQIGKETPLMEGTTREWVIESIIQGYPVDQINLILRKAEKIAFEKKDYCRFQEIRHLKFRLENAPEFGMYGYTHFDELQEYIGLLVEDKEPFEWMLDNLSLVDDGNLAVVSKIFEGNEKIFSKCMKEINLRIKLDRISENKTITYESKYARLTHAILASGYNISPTRLIDYSEQFPNGHYKFFQSYIKNLMQNKKGEDILSLWDSKMPAGMKIELARVTMRYCYLEGIDLSKRLSAKHINSLPLLRCWVSVIDGIKPSKKNNCIEYPVDDYRYRNSDSAIYEHFFECFDIAFNGDSRTASTLSKLPDRDYEWIKTVIPKIEHMAKITANCFKRNQKARLNFGLLFDLLEEIEHPISYEGGVASFKSAIMNISFDLQCLYAKFFGMESFYLDVKRIDKCKNYKFYSEEIFFNTLTDTRLRIIKESQVEKVCNQRIKSNKNAINEIAERGDNYIQALRLCILYGINDLAKVVLRHAVSLLIGYYQRKDGDIHEVLSSIEECLKRGTERNKIINWLEKIEAIALQIPNTTERVEGAIEGYLDILVKVMPKRVLEIRNEYLKEEEWYYADVALSSFIRGIDLSDPMIKSFCGSITFGQPIRNIKSLADKNNEDAAEVLSEIEKNVGIQKDASEVEVVQNSASQPKEKDTDIEYEYIEYPPEEIEQFISLVDSLNYLVSKEMIIKEWIDFWNEKGKGLEILNRMKDIRNEDIDGLYNFDRAWGYFFNLSFSLEGREKAYDWMVWDHIRTLGWNEIFYGREKIIERFQIISQEYKDKWQEFISDASAPIYKRYNGNIEFGQSKAVLFFFSVEKENIAESMTDTLIELLINDFEDFPFKEKKFNSEPIMSLSIFKSLLAQLRLPFPYMQIISIKKIVEILDNDTSEEFKNEFFSWLSGINLESEVVQGLIIVGLLNDSAKISHEDLMRSISKPSRLSDIYIEKIYNIYCYFNRWSVCHSGKFFDNFTLSSEFKNYNEMPLPAIYKMNIEKISREINFNFLKQWNWEFEKVREGEIFKNDIRYFYEYRLGSQIGGVYNDRKRNIFKSSYLRTLSFSFDRGISKYDIDNFCYEGFDFKLEKVKAIPKRNFFRCLEKEIEKMEDIEFIFNYIIENCYCSDDPNFFIANASFPVLREKFRNTDIEISSAVVHEEEKKFIESESFFESTESIRSDDDDSILSECEMMQEDIFKLSEMPFLPIAIKIFHWKYSLWHSEKMKRGVYALNPIIFKNISREYTGNSILFKINNRIIGKWIFWVDRWEPSHLVDIGPGIGTALLVEKDFIREYTINSECDMMSAIRITNMERDDRFGQFDTSVDCSPLISMNKIL